MSDCPHNENNAEYCVICLRSSIATQKKYLANKDSVIKGMNEMIKKLEGGRDNWYCENCGCYQCRTAEDATEQQNA